MVDYYLSLYAECLVKQVFINRAQTGNITHSIAVQGSNTGCGSAAKSPEVRQGRVTPEQLSVFHFVQLCDPDTVLVGGNMLCHYIHSDLCEI